MIPLPSLSDSAAALGADEGELEEVQEILQMIADAEYDEPDLL